MWLTSPEKWAVLTTVVDMLVELKVLFVACLRNVSGDDVEKTMQFASVKIGGMPAEPVHKSQKLKWDHKVQ